ncbi:hypothetical protein Emtol_3387 [Emticicia oligotrophica DSM 17448]|uniref:Uncharacterized protein n=1 Tax=Emticicia oligotrophica (strain DSM 17448 / CIP 109782 / MTCC 6937 / GPTSA100-15) TaxID=929562 RepID=A0ABM5N576_EMTOG|nr:hypothetical protein Emtol_3387 [Emticicia oligotrophica DSM 17448]
MVGEPTQVRVENNNLLQHYLNVIDMRNSSYIKVIS